MRNKILFLAGILLIWNAASSLGHAQVTSITPNGLGTTLNGGAPACTSNCTITGGTRPGNGANLFHSFGLFNVGTGDTANFSNNTNLPTTNILSRVTGGPSNIFGTIQTTGFGAANFFLINPAGVVFGPHASLDIGRTVGTPGAFHVSTADYLRLGTPGAANAGVFSANPLVGDILTSAPVTAFGFLKPNPAAIAVQGSTLAVGSGQTISVVGGDITMTGGMLSAPGGQINLASVASPGEVLFPGFQYAANVNGDSFTALGNITLDQGAVISTVGDPSFGDGSGGAVLIRGGQFVATGATIMTSPADFSAGSGGVVTVAVSDSASLTDVSIVTTSMGASAGGAVSITADGSLTIANSTIDSTTQFALGDSGPVSLITSGPLSVTDSQISTFALISGNGGGITASGKNVALDGVNLTADGTGDDTFGMTMVHSGAVTLTATEMVTLSNSRISNTGATTVLDGSPVTITGTTINILNGSTIDASMNNGVLSPANAGVIEIHGSNVNVTGSQLFSNNSGIQESTGGGGNIRFVDANNIQLTAAQVNSSATTGGGGGAIEFQTRALRISNGADIATGSFGQGSGGTITVRGAESVTIESGSRVLTTVVIAPASRTQGPAGNILFETQNLTIGGGSLIKADALPSSTGNAGNISVHGVAGSANSVVIDGAGSGIFTNTQGTGAGGNIALNANTVTVQNGGTLSAGTSGTAPTAIGGTITVEGNQVQLSNGATISANSTGPGNAGNISISASDSLLMQNHSSITTQATQSDGGNITIRAGEVVQLINSSITTSVGTGAGNGGNITIDPQFVILQNSQILAEAFGGSGGNINIVAGVFLMSPDSVIDASSKTGISGNINIQSPINDLSGSLVPLPSGFLKAGVLFRSRCSARVAGETTSTFVLAGKGGIPTEPGGTLISPLPSTNVRSARLSLSSTDVVLRVAPQFAGSSTALPPLGGTCSS